MAREMLAPRAERVDGALAPAATVTTDGALDGLEVVPGCTDTLAEVFA